MAFFGGNPGIEIHGTSYDTQTAYSSGTSPSLTASMLAITFGTTSPSITIDQAGIYIVIARAKVDYVGATFLASRNVSLKIRRTNNSAADIANSTTSFATQIITALSFSAQTIVLPHIIYTTANNNDVLSVFGGMDVIPTAGSIQVTESSIVAIKIL